jgi:hypothetical protein
MVIFEFANNSLPEPIGSMYGIYANIGGILMVNVSKYSIHGSYGEWLVKLVNELITVWVQKLCVLWHCDTTAGSQKKVTWGWVKTLVPSEPQNSW